MKRAPIFTTILLAVGLSAFACVEENPDTQITIAKEQLPRLWQAATVLIGNSLAAQLPSPFIECPLFKDNGTSANASHTLDLSLLGTTGQVHSTITVNGVTFEPSFTTSLAADVTVAEDGSFYLLVGGEGELPGDGINGAKRIIIRCKYKVEVGTGGQLLLVSCINCVVIFVRD